MKKINVKITWAISIHLKILGAFNLLQASALGVLGPEPSKPWPETEPWFFRLSSILAY